ARMGTWVMMLFPDIERSDVYQQFTVDPAATTATTTPIATPSMDVLICPSDPPDDRINTDPTALSYVANCGIPDDQAAINSTTLTVADATSGTSTVPVRPTNGMFYDRYSPKVVTTTPIPTDVASSLNRIPDGASNTLLLTENFTPSGRDLAN